MGLGNNRDYTKTDQVIRRRMAVIQARVDELVQSGMDRATAFRQASAELTAGELKAQLKAWKDPIAEHRKRIRAARKAQD